jgi:hypothetical protein
VAKTKAYIAVGFLLQLRRSRCVAGMWIKSGDIGRSGEAKNQIFVHENACETISGCELGERRFSDAVGVKI